MVSLAKYIIYKTADEVENYIQQRNPKLDEIDEYGYTPLIEAAITNSVTKSEILLDAGADVNFTDLTGRTALHWAADNNNVELCKLLLSRGADPNSYTRAGQPALTMPLLRNQFEIKQLFYRYGVDLNFAQDFINAKLLGHRFDLEGRVDIVNPQGTFFEMEFEGFYTEFSLAMLVNSLIDFKNNYGGKHLRKYFPKLEIIIDTLENANTLIKYQHYLANTKENDKEINQRLDHYPLVIPIAYDGHAISLIKFDKWLVRCDRGEFGRNNGTVIIYRMNDPRAFDKLFIKFLLYKRQHRQFIDDVMANHLQLQPVRQLPLTPQISGNCAWANIEATIPTLMYLLLLDEAKNQAVVDMENCLQQAMHFFNEWEEWDKSRALYFCIQSYKHADKRRRASKAAILAAILVQQCQYGKPKDLEKSEKILSILTDPNYVYILKSYIEVFSEEKDNPHLKNLLALLDDYGIDIQNL